MPSDLKYEDYVSNQSHMAEYREYQKRYAAKMRESDRVLLDLVRSVAAGKDSVHLLDIGCSTGNLLLHLKHQLPGVRLAGADLESHVIAENARNAELSGIEFKVVDIVKFDESRAYDVITCNAMLCTLDEAQLEASLRNIAKALRPGGALIVFDWIFPFDQRLEIVEYSRTLPEGFRITMRSQNAYRAQLEAAGFQAADFRPFHMPFDLPRPSDPSDMTTYTVADAAGQRMSFRGALYQPWCHLIARVA